MERKTPARIAAEPDGAHHGQVHAPPPQQQQQQHDDDKDSTTACVATSTPGPDVDGHDGIGSDSHSNSDSDGSPGPSPAPDPTPPYWTARPHRSTSSVGSALQWQRSAGIRLEDRSSEAAHEGARACWAASVRVDQYVVVSGATGMGAYVVWHCTVDTLQGGALVVRKRYSEFDHLRADLVRAFPHAAAMIPLLPRKSVVSRFRPKFLEQRRAGLSHFLNCILLNPEFAASPILKDFIFN